MAINKNITLTAENVKRIPAVITFAQFGNRDKENLVTRSVEGFTSWAEAVKAARYHLVETAVEWNHLDAETAWFFLRDCFDCSSEQFKSQFCVDVEADFDPDRNLLRLRLEDDYWQPGLVIAEVQVLLVPELKLYASR